MEMFVDIAWWYTAGIIVIWIVSEIRDRLRDGEPPHLSYS